MNRDILRTIVQHEHPHMMNVLDDLLDEAEKHGTFHDARVVDAQEGKACTTIRLTLCVGDPDATRHDERERRRVGTLVLHDVHELHFDPPNVMLGNCGSLWLTADGPIDELDSDAARQSPLVRALTRRTARPCWSSQWRGVKRVSSCRFMAAH